MTAAEARQIANAEIATRNTMLNTWNAWTDANNWEQYTTYRNAYAAHQDAHNALRNADLNYPHLFAIFAGNMVGI